MIGKFAAGAVAVGMTMVIFAMMSEGGVPGVRAQVGASAGAEPTKLSTTVGPSFSCDSLAAANQPTAQAICMNPGIARAELHYVMAYQALSQMENPAPLRAEATAFISQINDACGLPATGHLSRPPSAQQVACITGQFMEQRSRLLLRLQGDALNEARLTPEQAMDIQQTLKAAPVDGVFGPATRAAIRNWQRVRGLPETGFGSTAMLSYDATAYSARTAPAYTPTPATPAATASAQSNGSSRAEPREANAQAQSECAPFQRVLYAAVAVRTDAASPVLTTYLSLGVNPLGGTIAEAAARFLSRVRVIAQSTPESMLGPSLYQPYGLGRAGLSLIDVYHLKNYSDPQMKALADMIVKCEP